MLLTPRSGRSLLRAILVVGAAVAGACSDSSGSSPTTPGDGGSDGSTSGQLTDGGSSGTSGTSGSSGSSGTAEAGAAGGIFQAPNAWNQDVSALPKASRSDAIIGALQSLGGWGTGKFKIDFSISILEADAATPTLPVTAASGYYSPDGDTVPTDVPFPVNGNAEGSADYTCDTANNDCHILVLSRSRHTLFELYNATKSGSSVSALGLFSWDLTRSYPATLRGDQCTSADAAGLPMAALIPTADEVAAGEVAHAIRFILPNPRIKKGVYVHPATHAGGPSSANADAPPYGVRFRLASSFDETSYSPGAKVILRAMKRYGIILSDGGNIALTFADDRLSTAKWAGVNIDALSFSAIKVSDFEVVDLGPEIPLTYDCVRTP